VASSLLDAYLQRIGVSDPGAPDAAGLRRLHAAHVEAVPFENLDVLLGRGIHLDLDRLRDKLIAQRRGGYCFEQNTLFLETLRELGFAVMPMEARVRVGTNAVLPRTHMVLRVEIEGEAWLADVGFGGEGPREPVPMRGEDPTRYAGLAYRVIREEELHVLQMRGEAERAGWVDQYAFLVQPVHPVDFKVANWFTSTYPESPFVRTLTVQRATRDVRYLLRYPVYTEIRETGRRTRDISRGELLPLLREVFRIDLPDDTVFPAIDGAGARIVT
jgi:N-hydroxyarylamine O-acetyltransferase